MRAALIVAPVLLLGLGAVPIAAQDGPAERAFATAAVPRIEQAFPGARVTMEPGDPLQINVTRKGEKEPAVINLHRVFGFCQAASEADCTQELARLIDVLAKAGEGAAPAVTQLRIIVRDGQYMDHVKAAQPGSIPLNRQIGEDLYAILAFDRPETIALALARDIADLGLSQDNAWSFASRQTARIIPREPTPIEGAEGLTIFRGEEYTGSMMAYPDRWASLAEANGPNLAVIANSDQFVVVAIVPDGPELARFRDLAASQCKLAARCISPNVYRWREGRWVIAR